MTPDRNGKFVAYYRVSTEEQGDSGLGLEAQRQKVREFVNGGGAEIVDEFTEVESGTNGERPELEKALSSARAYGATLVVAKLDRLARDVGLLHRLQDSDVEIEIANMPGANGLTVNVLAAVAEHEAEQISQRTREALAASDKDLGTPENLTQEDREKGAEAAAEKRKRDANQRARDLAPILREIEEKGATTLRQKAEALEARGIPTARDGSWHAATVSRLEDRIENLD